MIASLTSRLTRFRRSERGSATIIALLWLPVLMGFFILIFDVTYVFIKNGDIRRVTFEGNRQYVRGFYGYDEDSLGDLEDWIEANLATIAPNATATATVDEATGRLETWVSYPASDTDITGWISQLTGLTMTVLAVNQTEV